MIIHSADICQKIFESSQRTVLLYLKGAAAFDYPGHWVCSSKMQGSIREQLRYAKALQNDQSPESVYVIEHFQGLSQDEKNSCMGWFQENSENHFRCLILDSNYGAALPKGLSSLFVTAYYYHQKNEYSKKSLRERVLAQFQYSEKAYSKDIILRFISQMIHSFLAEIEQDMQHPVLYPVIKKAAVELTSIHSSAITHPLLIQQCQWVCFEYLCQKKRLLQNPSAHRDEHAPK